MKRAILLLIGLSVGGCENEADVCSALIVKELRAPSTFQFVASKTEEAVDAEPPYVWVNVDFDAQNAFGGTLRQRAGCKFEAVDGRPDTDRLLEPVYFWRSRG